MLIMRQGEVMAAGDDIDEIADYAKKYRTRVVGVEICSTLGGFYQLVVRWADKAIGQFWTTDRATLHDWATAQPRWPRPVEYSVKAKPVLLDMPAPEPQQEPEPEAEEPDGPVRIRRRRRT